MKRQAARFRVYAFNKNDEPIAEVTSDVAEIEWEVHIANRKAAWYEFRNPMDTIGVGPNEKGDDAVIKLGLAVMHRNRSIYGKLNSAEDRKALVIDAGPQTIKSSDAQPNNKELKGHFTNNTNRFGQLKHEVILGELKTDDNGRLLVLPGWGDAKGAEGALPIDDFANNDLWYDDTSDGTVYAKVTLNGDTEAISVGKDGCGNDDGNGAFVACVPPNFCPGLFAPVTMYDIVNDVYHREKHLKKVKQPSFEEHIWPILERLHATQWVSQGVDMTFGNGSTLNFRDEVRNDALLERKCCP